MSDIRYTIKKYIKEIVNTEEFSGSYVTDRYESNSIIVNHGDRLITLKKKDKYGGYENADFKLKEIKFNYIEYYFTVYLKAKISAMHYNKRKEKKKLEDKWGNYIDGNKQLDRDLKLDKLL